MHTGQINLEQGSQSCRTGVQVLDGLLDVGEGRRRSMLTRFQVGRQLGIGPTDGSSLVCWADHPA